MKRLIIAAMAVLLAACTQVDTGNVGVERTLGKVSETELPPGIYWTLFKNVDEITTKEVAFSVNDLRPKSKDNLTMQDVDVDVYFRTQPGKVADLFVKYQGDLLQHKELVKGGTSDLVVGFNRVFREAREAVYTVVAQYEATLMHTQRTEIAEGIRLRLQAELDRSDPGAFVVTTINVRNLTTDPAIEAAIRLKAEMDQKIGQKQKEIEFARAEMDQRVLRQQMEIEIARQNAERARVEAEGQAKANKLIAESVTPNLLALRNTEVMMEFAKKGSTTVLMPHDSRPFVQVK